MPIQRRKEVKKYFPGMYHFHYAILREDSREQDARTDETTGTSPARCSGKDQSPDAAAWSSGTATGTTSSADATGDTPQSQGVGRGVVTASCIFPATPENFNGDDADWREQSRFFRSWVARFCKSRVHAKLETVAQHRDNRTHVLDLFAAHAKTTRMICLNSQRSHTMSWSRSCAERTRSSS